MYDSQGNCKNSSQNEDSVPEKLKELRKIIQERKKFECPMTDDFLIAFLRARKYNLEEAFNRLDHFFLLKASVFKAVNLEFLPSVYSKFIQKKYLSIFKSVESQAGLSVAYFQTERWEPSELNFDQLFAVTFFVILEAILSSPDLQINGVIVLIDLKNFGFRHAREHTLSRIRNVVKITQDSFPVRIKGIYFINNPIIFNMIFSMAKPFLKEKLKNRMIFHGYDLSSLHKVISPEILPIELGGHLTFEESIDNNIFKMLLAKDEFYRELDTYNNSLTL